MLVFSIQFEPVIRLFTGEYSQLIFFILGVVTTAVIRYGFDYFKRRRQRVRIQRELAREISEADFTELQEWIKGLTDDNREADLEALADEIIADAEDYKLDALQQDEFKYRFTYMLLREATPRGAERLRDSDISNSIYESNLDKLTLLSESQVDAIRSFYQTLEELEIELENYANDFATDGAPEPDASVINDMKADDISVELSRMISRLSDMGETLDQLDQHKHRALEELNYTSED
jgi:hypothetical protein